MNNELYTLYKARCSQIKTELKEFFDYSFYSDYEHFKDIMSEEEFSQVLRFKRNRCNKRSRTKSKLSQMISYYCHCGNVGRKLYMVFGSGTIEDKYLLGRKTETRNKLLNQYLRKYYDVVMINNDIGSKTEREHYHWIGITSFEPIPVLKSNGNQRKSAKGFPLYVLPNNEYPLGHNPDLELINISQLDVVRNYMLKLNNHSNKATTSNRLRVLKGPYYRSWDCLVNDLHQKDVRQRVIARRVKREKDTTK